MYEMEKNESHMARLQREDATKMLNSVSTKQMKLSISTAIIILLTVLCVISTSMTTVSALSSAGILKSDSEIIDPDRQDDPSDTENGEGDFEYVELNYIAGQGGTISGSGYQICMRG